MLCKLCPKQSICNSCCTKLTAVLSAVTATPDSIPFTQLPNNFDAVVPSTEERVIALEAATYVSGFYMPPDAFQTTIQ